MGSPTTHREVINGRMTHARPRRGYVEVLVFAGPDPEKGEEPVGDWEMPIQMRYNLGEAARIAERQTRRDS